MSPGAALPTLHAPLAPRTRSCDRPKRGAPSLGCSLIQMAIGNVAGLLCCEPPSPPPSHTTSHTLPVTATRLNSRARRAHGRLPGRGSNRHMVLSRPGAQRILQPSPSQTLSTHACCASRHALTGLALRRFPPGFFEMEARGPIELVLPYPRTPNPQTPFLRTTLPLTLSAGATWALLDHVISIRASARCGALPLEAARARD